MMRIGCKCAMAAIALFAVAKANAAIIAIDDTVFGQITITANDFEGGLNVDGMPFQSGLGSPSMATIPGEGPVLFQGSWIDLGANQAGMRTVYFVESFDNNCVSDIWSATYSTDGFIGSISATFTSSAIDCGLGVVPPGTDPSNIIVEGGTANVDLAFLSIPITTVPEPTTCCLVAAGIALLAARRRAH